MGAFLSTQAHGKTGDPVPVENIRQAMLTMLAHCKVPYVVKPYDQVLHDRCLAVCQERGYPIDSNDRETSLLPYLRTGVYVSSIGYDHLKSDLPRLTYIALFTTFAAYMDDLFKRDVESVAVFGKRLIQGERQGHPVLEGMADLLNDTETHFGRTAANMIVHDTLGFFNALLLAYETQGLPWSPDAIGFPNYIRLMNGLPTAYAMFIFPTEMPLKSYIQSLPEVRDYICYSNDVLSFYKEEIRGEDDNYITLVSVAQKNAKNEVLQKLGKDVGRTTDQVDKILRGDPAALRAWSNFKAGYIYFHASDPRYELDRVDWA